jgi:Asp-tRNA(Asn)/Glu-tRNA(Gln) amidotransferase A subunit family amidase
MNDTETPVAIIDRLRANLAAAGIAVDEADIAGMAEKGLLRNPVAFEELDRRLDRDLLPDYLDALAASALLPIAPPRPSSALSAGAMPSRNGGHPTIVEIAERVKGREVSPVELTQQAIERINERDQVLNAFQCLLVDEALVSARAAEDEIRAGQYRGPLHGIPLAVKDLLAMTGTITAAGSRILGDWRANFDAAGVERLRQAGAVIVGKTRLPEFAYSPGSNNAHYGPTLNPWNLGHDTGGSSAGSGAAVADGLVFAALGSDTGGSIRIPAALCGIVGLKPTFGRVSLYGAIPLAWSLDHLGPMTRGVADAALLLQALAGHDPRDRRTHSAPAPLPAFDLDAGVLGLRIGVLREDGTGIPLGRPEVLGAWHAGLATLERQGGSLVELDLPEMRDLRTVNGAIIALEAAAYHEPWLRDRLQDYGEFARQRLLTSFAYAPNALVRAQQARSQIRRRFDAIFDSVDLLSTPTVPYGAPELGVPAATVFTGPFNALGWPTVSVPVGMAEGRLPLGMQLAGRRWDEARVLQAARVLEVEGPWPGGRP